MGLFMSYVIADQSDVQDNNFHGAHMGPTRVLSAPGGPNVDHMNLAIRGSFDW